jgi:low affinity Fe/Cu permease
MKRIGKLFSVFAQTVSRWTGRSISFIIAFTIVIIWAISGPFFGFSDTWQLVINTGTTIVTFLMVFLIQNAQNRDTAAIQVKLDELIYVNTKARNKILDLESKDEEEIERVREEFSGDDRANP